MQPSGAIKNKLAHAIFSKDGPNLTNPAVTSKPKVTPNKYKLNNKKINGMPILKIETPNRGIAINVAGTKPIRVLIRAEDVRANIISEILRGDTNKLMIFLLHISSRKSIL